MKLAKFAERIGEALKGSGKKSEKDALKKILKKLKKRELKLKGEIDKARSDKERRVLQAKPRVVKEHRKKALSALKSLKKK